MRARRGVAALAVGLLMMTAGCGFITGSEPLTFSASPATVADQTLAESPYEEVNVTEQVITREFTVAGQTRRVKVVNQLARYERRVDLGPLGSRRAAVFVAFASPEVEIGTESFNPIEDVSVAQMLERSQSRYGSVSVGEQVGTRNVTVLDQSTVVTKYEGTATLAGSQVDIYLHTTKVNHEDDFVVVIAIYPQRLPNEEKRVINLLEGLEHAEDE